MADPKDNPKPFIPTREIKEQVYDPITNTYKTVFHKQLVLNVLNEDILNTGNLDTLVKFQEAHRAQLDDPKNKAEKDYLDARIRSSKETEKLEKKALAGIAFGKNRPLPQPDNKDGFLGFSDIKYPDFQTSSNGCWSISYSMLLKSRGIDLSQEKIRAWRPDYAENAPAEEKANENRLWTMNTDVENNIFSNADLLSKVAPNTGLSQLQLDPADTEHMTINGQPLNDDEKFIVEVWYKEQMKKTLKETITNAFTKDHSPVSLSWDGHYVTVTGIKEDGTIRYEESLENRGPQRTKTMTLDELVEQGFLYHKNPAGETVAPKGLSLSWLNDINMPDYKDRKTAAPTLVEGEPDLVNIDENGALKVAVPVTHPTKSSLGKPADGMTAGKGTTENLEIDQAELSEMLGGKKLDSFARNGGYAIGSLDKYYPNKVYYKNDPNLLKDPDVIRPVLNDNRTTFDILQDLMQPLSHPGDEEMQLNSHLADARSALDELLETADGEEPDPEELSKSINNLRTLPGFLMQKQKDGRSNLEVLDSELSLEQKKQLRDQLQKLHEAIDLGPEYKQFTVHAHEAISGMTIEEENRQKDQAYAKKIKDLWDEANKTEGIDPLVVDDRTKYDLARLVAMNQLWLEARQNGDEHPMPSEIDIEKRAYVIQKSKAFKNLMANDNFRALAEGRSMNALVMGLAEEVVKAQQKLKEAKGYDISGKLQQVKEHTGDIINILRGTQTGSYMGFDIVKRKRNTGKYETALAAVEDFYNKPNPDTADVKAADDIVLNYLDGYETVRTREFGRIRWHQFMTFLADTMPPKKFAEYCDRVNQKRDVSLGSSKYVAPEQFKENRGTVGNLMEETLARIQKGEGTNRDYALLISLHKYGSKESDGQFFNPHTPITSKNHDGEIMKKISHETDLIMKDPNFKLLMNSADKTMLKEMVAPQGPEGSGQRYSGVGDIANYQMLAEQFRQVQQVPMA